MRIGLAALPFAGTIDRALEEISGALGQAAVNDVRMVCTPESYLPGYPGVGYPVDPIDADSINKALAEVSNLVRYHGVALILGTEVPSPEGTRIRAVVFDASGRVVGAQDKVQLDPDEDGVFLAGTCREMFEIDGLRFGISICHEATHYPETVRWAAVRGAHIVFHPQLGFPTSWGGPPESWAEPRNSLHEKTYMCRAAENSIYFATVNYALENSRTTTAVINPDGSLLVHQPYGKAGLLIADIDLQAATGKFARRFAPNAYGEKVRGCSELAAGRA